jgi:hypothetical protein
MFIKKLSFIILYTIYLFITFDDINASVYLWACLILAKYNDINYLVTLLSHHNYFHQLSLSHMTNVRSVFVNIGARVHLELSDVRGLLGLGLS